MPRRLFVLIAVIAVCAAAWLCWRRSDTPPAQDAEPSERSMAAATPANPVAGAAATRSEPSERPLAHAPASADAIPAAPVQLPAPTPPTPRTPPAPKPATQPTRAALAAMLDAPIDRNHAIDLFAEHLAKLDVGGGDAQEKESAQRLQAFDARADGGDDSQRLARELQTHLDQWLSQFPGERANHFALIAVECRVGACQVLLAESSVDPTSTTGRNAADLTPALIALLQTRWAQQRGLAFVSADMSAADADADGIPRYALWTIHLSVASSG